MGTCDTNTKTVTEHLWSLSDLVATDPHYGYDESIYDDELAFDQTVECYEDVLTDCFDILDASPTAQLMIREAVKQNWRLALADLKGCDYEIDMVSKCVTLNTYALSAAGLAQSGYFRNAMLVNLSKALRDIWQEKRYGGFEKRYSPDHILMMERIRNADLDVVSLIVAWELRSEEYSDMWRHAIGSDIGDMAMAFSGHLERDPGAQFTGRALQAAFKQWFCDNQRVSDCDHDTLDYMDDVLHSTMLRNPFGRRRPSRMDIEVLSCLPDRSAYLQGQGAEILENAIFSAVNNDINQTHLFHIMYDLEAVIVEDVPFRSADLARKIFPQG